MHAFMALFLISKERVKKHHKSVTSEYSEAIPPR